MILMLISGAQGVGAGDSGGVGGSKEMVHISGETTGDVLISRAKSMSSNTTGDISVTSELQGVHRVWYISLEQPQGEIPEVLRSLEQ